MCCIDIKRLASHSLVQAAPSVANSKAAQHMGDSPEDAINLTAGAISTDYRAQCVEKARQVALRQLRYSARGPILSDHMRQLARRL